MKNISNPSIIIEFNKYEQLKQLAFQIKENYEGTGKALKKIEMEEFYEYFLSYNELLFAIQKNLDKIPSGYQSQAETLMILLQRLSWDDFTHQYFIAVLQEYIKQLNQRMDGFLLKGVDSDVVYSIIGGGSNEYIKK